MKLIMLFTILIIAVEIPVFIRDKREEDLFVLVGASLALALMIGAEAYGL